MESLEEIEFDEAWMRELPADCTYISTTRHGNSFWSSSACVEVRLQGGKEQKYFLKITESEQMVIGEFESMKALFDVSPDLVPEPIACGRLERNPKHFFFLCHYLDLQDDGSLPEPAEFCQHIARLHRKSMDKHTSGLFGFHVTTCNGTIPQDNTWNISWEAFFIQSLKHEFDMERRQRGPCEEYDVLLPALFNKVCPALLRPLETEGRTLRPCLVHGDLWDGNVALHAETGRPYIFDSSALWAHNEYELSTWRGSRHRMTKPYVEEYFKHFPQSRPEQAWDDRNLLYSLRDDLHDSILYPTSRIRDGIIASMQKLVDKYPNGYTGSAQRRDHALQSTSLGSGGPESSVTGSSIQPVHTELSDLRNHRTEHHQNNLNMNTAAASIGFATRPRSMTSTRADVEIALGESARSPPEGSVASEP